MTKQVLLAFIGAGLCSQLFFSCQKHEDEVTPEEAAPVEEATPAVAEVPPVSKPGFFVISSIERSTAAAGRKAAIDSVRFDLGALKASKEFLFMIANGGDESIFDVTLTTDQAAFEVFPRKIQLVPGRKGSAIIPLLTVGITHGVNLNGTGKAPNLPKGENKATITMKGKTLSGKDTVLVEGQFVVAVEAKVVDVKLTSEDVDVVPIQDAWASSFWVVQPPKSVKLVNTGSVAIQAGMYYVKYPYFPEGGLGSQILVKHEIELQPGEAKDITGFVSKPEGYYTEEGIRYSYPEGKTYIDIKDQGVVYNINFLILISK